MLAPSSVDLVATSCGCMAAAFQIAESGARLVVVARARATQLHFMQGEYGFLRGHDSFHGTYVQYIMVNEDRSSIAQEPRRSIGSPTCEVEIT